MKQLLIKLFDDFYDSIEIKSNVLSWVLLTTIIFQYFLMFHFKNLESCVVNKEKITLICMDDKAKIPVGQPGTPKAATSLMQKTWTAKGVTL